MIVSSGPGKMDGGFGHFIPFAVLKEHHFANFKDAPQNEPNSRLNLLHLEHQSCPLNLNV